MSNSKIIISIDVGTSRSAVSYLHQRPGQNDAIKQILDWPGQADADKGTLSASVPTLMYYKNKSPCAYGYYAQKELLKNHDERTRDGWHLIKEFKRHVHRLMTNSVSPLENAEFKHFPVGVSLAQIYEGWLRYLIGHAEKIIFRTCRIGAGDDIWSKRTVVFVVSNGWSEPDQAMLRQALVNSGCVQAQTYVRFASESEVALQSALGIRGIAFKTGLDFMVCDVGAATADVALYNVSKENPLEVREKQKAPSMSVEAGSSLARETTRNMFVRNVQADDQSLAKEEASPEQNKTSTAALDTQIKKIVDAIDQVKGIYTPKYLILGGGFFREEYVRKKLDERYPGVEIVHRLHSESKSADASLQCYLRNVVVARTSAYSYGSTVAPHYNENNPEHRSRGFQQYVDGRFVSYGWSELVAYGTVFEDGKPYGKDYYSTYRNKYADLSNIRIELFAGDKNANKEWVYTKDGKFMPGFISICIIKVNLSEVQGKMEEVNIPGGKYYKLSYRVEVDFGSTTSRATVIWKDAQGKLRRNEATFLPPDFSAKAWSEA